MCPGKSTFIEFDLDYLKKNLIIISLSSGLTHPNAKMVPVDENTVVAIMAEGKEHALAIGKTILSTKEIAEKNKGIGVENYHYLNDGLWNMKPVKS